MTLWNPRGVVNIPGTITSASEIVNYAKQLTKRETTQIIEAFNIGNYEMGSLFLWQKTMTALKKQLGSLGMDFISELLDRADIKSDSAATQVLTDFDAVKLSEELCMFSSTQAMRFRSVMQMVAHFSETPDEDEEDDDDDERQMMPEEAIQCLRTCIQGVLAHSKLEGAIEFANFRQALEEKTFVKEDAEIQSLLTSPYFFKRTTLRVILALAKASEGAQLEHVLANSNVIIPILWSDLLKPDRWLVGRAYAEVHSEGRKTSASGLRKALLKVQGFDYVPEDLRSRSFIEAALALQSTHFATNNFYNEPMAVRHLFSLGSVIPVPALSQCITSLLCVRIGNPWGISWAAQDTATTILKKLNEERWRYYLNECLPGDEIILGKLCDNDIAGRWCDLINEFSLFKMEIKKKQIKELIEYSSKKRISLVTSKADMLRRRLTNG